MASVDDNKQRMRRLRGVYFGLLGRVDTDLQRSDERRHELTRALVGTESIRGLSVWQMQQLIMRVAQVVPTEEKFGVALVLPARRGDRRNDLATPPQVAAILAASHKITWTASPEAFVRERVLSELRRRNWNGWWDSLWKSEASQVICAMQRMTKRVDAPAAAPERPLFDPSVAEATFSRLAAGAAS